MPDANNKDVQSDQHICCLSVKKNSVTPKTAIYVDKQSGLSPTCIHIHKDRFSHDMACCVMVYFIL